MSESSNDRVGHKISNYRLVRFIGQGGFADVYLGEHIYLKTWAAVKILHTRTDDADQSDILNEARAIAQLEHPHIIRLFEYGIEDGYPFLIMSYAARGSLRNHHPKGSRLPTARVINYTQQIASALDYAHENKLIHRDVKPENMLIGQNEQLLLTDFGLVMMAQTSRSQSLNDLAGTVTYMAPEQLRGRPRFASDQYALGVVVYEWLCGKRPFTGSFGEIASQQMLVSPPSLCALEPGLAPEVEQVVFKALAKNFADRFESAGEFAHALSVAYGSPGQLTLSRPPTVPVESQPLQHGPSNTNKSVATISALGALSSRHDRGQTVEIPIDEALTCIQAAGASEQLNTVQAITGKQPGEPILSTAAETITPDTALQTLQLSPVIDAARSLPTRGNRDVKSILILIALLFLVGGSFAVGMNRFVDKQGTPTRPRSGLPSTVPTARGTSPTTSTTSTASTVGVSDSGTNKSITTSIVSTPIMNPPVATKSSSIQRVVPVLTTKSVPPTRAPIPTPSMPTPTPVQNTQPTPTADPDAIPTPDLDATPDPNITVPTPDTSMIPGLLPWFPHGNDLSPWRKRKT